ncbi:MAG: chromate efflux transporter [Dehalococcoidia bacterium]
MTSAGSLSEVARYFFRLGVIAFGGPAAHIAILRRDLVVQRRWLTDAEFVDMLGVTNLIPGPNSTEMTMHLGASRAGNRGLWIGGAAFILPAVVIVLAFAWAYVRYGDTPTAEGLLFGIQPVILAVIVQAIWGLRLAAVKTPSAVVVVVAATALALAGVGEVWLIFGAGIGLLVLSIVSGGRSNSPWHGRVRRASAKARSLTARLRFALIPLAAASGTESSLLWVFLVFLKIGAVLYGSGYVLVSFLETEFVTQRGWLTQQQLLDAVAVGQFTPGPVFTTATFVGYVLEGFPGAAVATVGIFLPSFLFVAITHPFIPRIRRSSWASPFLDGVNAAAIALMAVVTIRLATQAIDSAFQLAILAVTAIVLVRFSPNSVWLILAGAAAGLAHRALS